MILVILRKRFVALSLVSAFLVLAANSCWAEGSCPQGYYPVGGGNGGWAGCAPIPGSGGGQSMPPPDPGPQWATRWGAIAVDGAAGKFGGANDMTSERKAQRAAIKDCRKNGGKKCEITVSYYNQCGAMAWGNNRSVSWRGPEREATIRDAVAACDKETDNCAPYYAGCSYPVRVR